LGFPSHNIAVEGSGSSSLNLTYIFYIRFFKKSNFNLACGLVNFYILENFGNDFSSLQLPEIIIIGNFWKCDPAFQLLLLKEKMRHPASSSSQLGIKWKFFPARRTQLSSFQLVGELDITNRAARGGPPETGVRQD